MPDNEKVPIIRMEVSLWNENRGYRAVLGQTECFDKKKTEALNKLAYAVRRAAVFRPTRWVVGTKEGTILIGNTRPEGGSEYSMTGPGRVSSSYCSVNNSDIKQVLRDHANGSYEGVAWEMSI